MNTKIKFYLEGNVIKETDSTIIGFDNSSLDLLIDMITSNYRNPDNMTIQALKIQKWDMVEFDVDGTVYTRNYIVE